jgi:hypothetical protein
MFLFKFRDYQEILPSPPFQRRENFFPFAKGELEGIWFSEHILSKNPLWRSKII